MQNSDLKFVDGIEVWSPVKSSAQDGYGFIVQGDETLVSTSNRELNFVDNW